MADAYAKAAEASAKLAKVLVEAISKFGSWIARVQAAQDQTKAIKYTGFLEVYLKKVHEFIQKTNLKRLKEKGLRIGFDKPKEFTKEMAKEYAEKSLYLEATVNGVTSMLDLERASWSVVKSSVIKLGRFLLGKHGVKFATKKIKDDSAYRFFESYHEQSTAGVVEESAEEKNRLVEVTSLHDELDDVGDSDQQIDVELSAADLQFLEELNKEEVVKQ